MKSKAVRVLVMVTVIMTLQGVLPLTAPNALATCTSQEAGALSLPDGKVNQAYEYQLRTEGGLPPLTWRLVGGELPPGLSLDASGKLKGVPITPRREPYSFVIEVSDSSATPQRFAQPFLLIIQAAPLRIVMGPSKLRIVVPPTDVTSKEKEATPSADPPLTRVPIEAESAIE